MTNRDSVRKLNDVFRQTFLGGRVNVTAGLAERPDLDDILRRVRLFSDFNEANDPWQEHDFGSLLIAGEQIFWKIDYFASDLSAGSEDPGDPSLTTRVLTVMLAEDY